MLLRLIVSLPLPYGRGSGSLFSEPMQSGSRCRALAIVASLILVINLMPTNRSTAAPAPASVPATTRPATEPSTQETVISGPLPDPFTFRDGRRVKTVEDWELRRAELVELFQQIEY